MDIETPHAAPNPRVASTINTDSGTVTFRAPNEPEVFYDLAELTDATRHYLALVGLRTKITQGGHAAWAMLRAGETSVKAGRKAGVTPAKLNLRHEAIAHAHAEVAARKDGLKPLPGKRLADSPAFVPYVDTARAAISNWEQARVAAAMKYPEVLAHYNRLTGKEASLSEFFEAA